MSRKRLVVAASIVGILGAGGALAWAFWPGPPPTSAEQVYAEVMAAEVDKLPKDQVQDYIQKVSDTIRRMPPHESEKFFQQTFDDEALRDRLRSVRRHVRDLPEGEREKMPDLIPEDQRMRMMTIRMKAMVEELEAMDPIEREAMMAAMRSRFRGRGDDKSGGDAGGRRRSHPTITKDRIIRWHANSTPTERAEFFRIMQRMRRLRQGYDD